MISTSKDLEDWLSGKPFEWGGAISVRVAIRSLPSIYLLLKQIEVEKSQRDDVIFVLLRTLATSLIAGRYPDYELDNQVKSASASLRSFVNHMDRSISEVSTFVADAADVVVSGKSSRAAMLAGRAINGAHAASKSANRESASYFWNAIQFDCDWLAKNEKQRKPAIQASKLLSQPIWSDTEPAPFGKTRSEYQKVLSNTPMSWEVWIDWLESCQKGSPDFGLQTGLAEQISIRIASQSQDFWNREIVDINNEISLWLQEAKQDEIEKTNISDIHTNIEPSRDLYNQDQNEISKKILQNAVSVFAVSVNINHSAKQLKIQFEAMKPNDPIELEVWRLQYDLVDSIDVKSAEIVEIFSSMQTNGTGNASISRTSRLIQEIAGDFENWIRSNRPELVEWFIRLPIAILFLGLANLVGATMPVATPAILGLIGGPKLLSVLQALSNKRSDASKKSK